MPSTAVRVYRLAMIMESNDSKQLKLILSSDVMLCDGSEVFAILVLLFNKELYGK